MNFIDSINQGSAAWAEFMVTRSLDAALVFLLAGAVWLCVKRRVPAQFGYWLFLLVPLKLLVPALFSIPAAVSLWLPPGEIRDGVAMATRFPLFGTGSYETALIYPGGAAGSEPAAPSPSADALPPLGAPAVLMGIWMAGAAAMLSRHAWLEWKTRFMLRNTVPLDPRSVPLDLDELRAAAGIKRDVRWVTGRWARSPVAYGYFRPAVAVPPGIAGDFTVRQLRWVLLHELAHIKRGDAFVFLFQRIALSLFFFHPFAWRANALIGELREYACDDVAMAVSRSTPQECGEGFLGAVMRCNGLPTFALASNGLIAYNTAIKRRLTRILESAGGRRAGLSAASGTLLAAFALCAVPLGWKAASAPAGEWVQAAAPSPSAPQGRCLHEMAFDSGRNVAILRGGWNLGVLTDTWEWNMDNGTWKKASGAGPLAAYGAAMAYDPVREKTVSSGGFREYEVFHNAETWEWDGVAWEMKVVEDEPRCFAAMCFHPDRRTVIRQGGYTDISRKPVSRMEEWVDNQWKPLPDGGPPLALHRMVYDSRRGRLVVFGGIKGMGTISGETWEFDGVDWEMVCDTGPAAREGFGMVFDERRGVTVVFGGGLYATQGFADEKVFDGMWNWDGSDWTEILSEGLDHSNAYQTMTYDSENGRIVLFGGAITPQTYRPNGVWVFQFRPGGMMERLGLPF